MDECKPLVDGLNRDGATPTHLAVPRHRGPQNASPWLEMLQLLLDMVGRCRLTPG